MSPEALFEFGGLIAILVAFGFFVFGKTTRLPYHTRLVFMGLLILSTIKYFINGLEWSGMWFHAGLDPLEDFLDGIWSIAWFFLFYAYLMDIRQQDIRLNEERFRTVFEAAPLGVAIANAEGKFIQVNDNFCRSLGYRHSEMLEKSFMEITHPEDRPVTAQLVEEVVTGKRRDYALEKRYLRKDGQYFWASTRATTIKDEDNRINYWIGIVENIHERRTVLEELKKYKQMVTSSNDFIALIDTDYVYQAINTTFLKAAGRAREEVIGHTVAEVVGKQTFEQKLKPQMDRCLAGEEIHHKDWYTTPNFGKLYLDMVYYPVFESDRSVSGIVVNGRDVTQLKTLETQLLASQKLEALGTLSGGIAHNFNNLLMGIQGNAELALLDTDSATSNYKRLSDIRELVQSGSKLVHQLLGYARGGRYEMKTIDLNQLLQQIVQTFAATRKDINLRIDLETPLATIEADRAQIEQIILNLLVNAGDAMPEGGDLFIKTTQVDEVVIRNVSFDPKAGVYVLLSITDTGTGMDEETRDRIFDPFFTTKEMGRGTGLGLASVYGIVKGHNGYIDVASTKGQGTTFKIYLPASHKLAFEDAAKEYELNGSGQGQVLLVDDEAMIMDIGSQLLERLGYTVIKANSGKQALTVIEQDPHNIDVVILDMIMPEMSGGETFDRIRDLAPNMRVLLSSGYALDGQASKIMDRGCNGFIQKPFSLKELSIKLKEILQA